jgi:hypothetical protein
VGDYVCQEVGREEAVGVIPFRDGLPFDVSSFLGYVVQELLMSKAVAGAGIESLERGGILRSTVDQFQRLQRVRWGGGALSAPESRWLFSRIAFGGSIVQCVQNDTNTTNFWAT